MLVGLVSYGAGNSRSVTNALEQLGCSVIPSSRPDELERAEKIVFPGVGEARTAMDFIQRHGLAVWLRETTKPFLGICLGMQVFFERSTERETECLGLLPGIVDRFQGVKVPHMGWNRVEHSGQDPLFSGIDQKSLFYFAHSYFAPIIDASIGRTTYGVDFSSAVRVRNRRGVQFHPEKSGHVGLHLLRNFIERC